MWFEPYTVSWISPLQPQAENLLEQQDYLPYPTANDGISGMTAIESKIPLITDAIEIKAPFFDVDSCDVVWHGHYVKYFEEARCHLLDKIGYNYQTMREDGYFFPVVDMKIKYVAPLLFAQVFIVQTTLVEWYNRLKVNYEISDKATGEKITRGYTIQVAVEVKSKQMQFESPPRLIELVEAMR